MFIYDDNVLKENDFIELLKKIKKLKFSFISQAVEPGDKGYHFINDILDRKGNESEEVRDRAPTFNEELGLAMEPLPEGYTTKNLWLLF